MIKISGTVTRSDFRNQTQFVHHRLFKGHHIQTCGVGQIVQFHIEQCSNQQFGCHKSLIEGILVLYLPNQFIGNHLTGLIVLGIYLQYFRFHRPMFHYLRRKFHKILCHIRTRYSQIVTFGQHSVKSMSEFMKHCFHFIQCQ